MIALREAITHELTKRSHTVRWLEESDTHAWESFTKTYVEDHEGYIVGQMTPKHIVDALWFHSRPGRRTRDFLMMLLQLPDECVRPAKVHADKQPVFVLYYSCQ